MRVQVQERPEIQALPVVPEIVDLPVGLYDPYDHEQLATLWERAGLVPVRRDYLNLTKRAGCLLTARYAAEGGDLCTLQRLSFIDKETVFRLCFGLDDAMFENTLRGFDQTEQVLFQPVSGLLERPGVLRLSIGQLVAGVLADPDNAAVQAYYVARVTAAIVCGARLS